MFNQNEWVVYPGIGLYKVSDAVEISGKKFTRLVSENNPSVMIPTATREHSMVRKVCSTTDVLTTFRILKAPIKQDLPKKLPMLERVLVNKFKSGSIFEIAEMVKMLSCFKKYRKLSVNEMRFLDLGIKHLTEETAIVENISKEEAKQRLTSCLS